MVKGQIINRPAYGFGGKTAPVAILIVNGGPDPVGGSWIELCLSQVAQHTTPGQYQLYLWNNNVGCAHFRNAVSHHAPDARVFQPERHEKLSHFHAVPLQRMYETAQSQGHEWIVTLDSDSHPVESGWLDYMVENTVGDCVLTGVWRDELSDGIRPYIHASGLCVRQDFLNLFDLRFDNIANPPNGVTMDTLSDFTTIATENGFLVRPMRRSNAGQFHRLIGGVYGDFIYHHGAGSRRNILFWGEEDSRYRRQLNTVIASESASLLMTRYEQYMAYLQDKQLASAPIMQTLLHWLATDDATIGRRSVLAVLFGRHVLRDSVRSLRRRISEVLPNIATGVRDEVP